MLSALTALALALVAEAPGSDSAPAPQLTKLPVLLHFVEAPYPEAAFAEGREGSVGLWLDVDADGLVQRVELAESAGADFDAAAMAAAAQFIFEPAEAEGLGPVPVRIRYRYRFVLRAPVETSSTATTTAPLEAPDVVPPINLTGRVLEAGSRAPVPFASIELDLSPTATIAALATTSTETGTDGRFALRGVPAGRQKLRVSAPLFETLEIEEQLARNEQLEVLYYLQRAEKDPYEVIVRAKRPRKEVARRTLQMEEIQRVPGAQGDAIRVIQNLPGVARTPFGLGLLVVRGAPPQSTGVFLDGHRMPLLFHFGGVGGVTSVINSRILEQISFYPGGFGPEYGRLSAGVVELTTRDAKTDRVHGEAQVDFLTVVPINVSVFLEGPITGDPDDGAFVFSLRRSSIDGVLALATEILDSSVALAPRYYDYQVRYDKPLGSRQRMLSLFAYGSDDELILVGADDLGGNAGGPGGTRSRTWFHRFNPKVTWRGDDGSKLVISPLLGVDSSNTETSGSGPNGNFSLSLKDWNAGARIDGSTPLADWITLSAGGELLYFEFLLDSELPAFGATKDFPSPINTDVPLRRDTARVPVVLAALYAELELEPLPGLKLWPGLRFDAYDYQADPEPLIDPRLVEGRSKLGLDPRITARYQLLDRLALKGQAGVYREPPLPPQLFVNADLPLQTAEQYSVGFELDVIDKLLLDVQGFYRFAHEVPRPVNAVEVVAGRVRPVGFLPEGEQRSFGMELLLKLEKRWGLYGWIAYTLSRSEIRRFDQEWQPNFFFDQTHNLNLVAIYELGLSWNAGVRFRYVTGGGLASTEQRWYDADRDAYNRRFGDQERAPSFHQLDLYLEKRWTYDQWYLEAYLDVQNVYNQTNTEVYVPTFDFKNTVAIPGLPFFPALGIRGVF